MKIHWPWRNLGLLGFKFKSGFYIDFFFKPQYGIFISNPNRGAGSWSCKYCRHKLRCIESQYSCVAHRTWIYFTKPSKQHVWHPFFRRVRVEA